MIVQFYTMDEVNGSIRLKIPLRSSANTNFENDDKFGFLWLIIAQLQPWKNSHPNRVSKCRQYFNELNIEGNTFTNGFKCPDV